MTDTEIQALLDQDVVITSIKNDVHFEEEAI